MEPSDGSYVQFIHVKYKKAYKITLGAVFK